ncbi:PTS sugar transporter subunit IIC, partial [Enterococcus faecium]|nr:PTS sugar transporter subunit IIC [Enterococcus faecium]MDB7489702.1 PTS sugar transporter subunit IIC [Enterococcus faecium]MDB7492243.1 PTS sugar transporter subunit IIC [Enterococcus faecium]MDB7494907.1 PTS sugar transporter subunit IIC [Enterococcus faecium]MDB7497302.1 PTS sugar transporter subunit IIC [Enterococcus faecium]
MIVQAVLLGIVAFIAQSEYALGTSLLSRPIVTGLFTGIVLGWNGNSFFDKFYKVQNFFPYAIPIVL